MMSFSSSALDVVQLLLDWGADLRAVDSSGFSVILTAAKGHNGQPNEAVLDVLLDREDIERMEKIKALELTGAIILSYPELYPKEVHLCRAFRCWRRALILRTIHHVPKADPLILIDGRYTEWTTLEELKKLEKGTREEYQTQSLLVLLRILSGLGFKALKDYLDIHYSFAEEGEDPKTIYFTEEECQTCGLMLTALDFCWIVLTVLHRRYSWHCSEKANVRKFAVAMNKYLVRALSKCVEGDDPLIQHPETWKTSLDFILVVDLTDYVEEEGAHTPYLQTFFNLFSILSKLPS